MSKACLVVVAASALLACGGGGKRGSANGDERTAGPGGTGGDGGDVTGGTRGVADAPPAPSDLLACPSARTAPWPSGRDPAYRSPLAAENSLPGEWLSFGVNAYASGGRQQIEAYTSRASARAGDTVDVKVSTASPAPITWRLYRVGWYGGAGARKVASGNATASPQPTCGIADASTGLVRCSWPSTFSLSFGPELVSGYYVVQVQRGDGCGPGGTSPCTAHAPIVLVDERPADILVQAGTNTWQAYNTYMGQSLYLDSSGQVPGGLSIQVSYDRPYAGQSGLPSRLIRYEMPFARWAERMGYDATYTTTFDAALGQCPHIARAGMFIQVGHDEYTPTKLRYSLDAARDAGVSLAFLSGNPLYWRVRLDDFADPRNPRTVTVYKAIPSNDPNRTDPTGRWRDAPIDHPENALVGVMYESWQVAYFPLVVEDPTTWLFRGTGVKKGDAFPGLVGHEYDWRDPLFASVQPSVQVHMRSPLVDALGVPAHGETVSYRAPSGALVFGAGTIQWAYGLGMTSVPDDMLAYGVDPRIERLTANVIEEAIGVRPAAGPFAAAPPAPAEDAAPASSVTKWAEGVSAPAGLVVASGTGPVPAGTIVVTAPRSNQVLRIDPTTKQVSVLAGSGVLGNADGTLAAAQFRNPTAVIQLPDGRFVVSDTQNYALRILDVAANTVTHLAGGLQGANGAFQRKRGFADGPAATALFKEVMGLAYEAAANRILVADSANQRVRAIALADGSVTTIAGNGATRNADGPALAASLFYPTGVAIAGGQIFILTPTNLRTVQGGNVATVAGGDVQGFADGTGAGAKLVAYGTLAASNDGTKLYFADAPNYRLRQLTIATGRVQTAAGQGRLVDANDAGGTALGMPVGVAVAPAGLQSAGAVYVSDGAFDAIREVR